MPGDENLYAFHPCRFATAHHFCTPFQAKFHFRFGHCSFVQIVACAFAHFHIDDAFLVGEVVVYSCIYYFQGKAVLPAEEVDTCPSMKEVADLLPGDFLWRQTDTFFYNAVVGGEDNVLRMFQGGG